MILYCDTSALLKQYIEEDGSEAVRDAFASSSVAVCRITWAEAMAALSRRERETAGYPFVFGQARARLCSDWEHFLIIEITQPLVELAGDLADTFALRAYDSVQLAAAKTLQDASGEPITFACFDTRLNKAAKVLGMTHLP